MSLSPSSSFFKHHGRFAAEDFGRVQMLAAVCDVVPGVRTTQPLALDLDAGVIAYGYEKFPPPLTEAFGDAARFSRLGELLAAMHEVVIPCERYGLSGDVVSLSAIGIPPEDADFLERSFPAGWVHGDFWQGNVFLDGAGGFLVVDPILPAWNPLRATGVGRVRASGALDLSSMWVGLQFCHPLRRELLLRREVIVRSFDAFLGGYLAARGVEADAVMRPLRKLFEATASHYIGSIGRRSVPVVSHLKTYFARRALAVLVERAIPEEFR